MTSSSKRVGQLLSAQGVKFLSSIVSLVVMSRLLTPDQFGYATVAVAVVGVGEVFRDMGLSAATIRSPQPIVPATRSLLWWINFGIGAALFILTWLLQGLEEHVFGTETASLLPWLGLLFLFNGASAQYRANINRDMEFGALAITDGLSTVLGLVIGVLLAWLGFGEWSIVWQYVITSALALGLFLWFSRWLPTTNFTAESGRGFLGLGLNVFVSQVWSYVGSNVDTMLLGHFHPGAAVGMYNRGFQLVMSPLNQLRAPANTFAIPSISRRTSDLASVESFLSRAQVVIGYTVLPLAALIMAGNKAIVGIVLGDSWLAVGPIAAILAVAGALQQLSSAANWVFTAFGLGVDLRRYSALSCLIKVCFVSVAAPAGANAVAVAYLCSIVVLWPISLVWALRRAHVRSAGLLASGLRMALLSTFAGALGLFVVHWLDPQNLLIHGILSAVCVVVTYCSMYLFSRSVRMEIRYAASYVWSMREMFHRK
jgi:PST family polysaccharide transporter